MTKNKMWMVFFVFAVGVAGIALAQPQGDRPADQSQRDEGAPRRDGRRDDEPPPPPPPKQKSKELFERDFPGPREGGRPGGDKSGPPKGKSAAELALDMLDRNHDGQLDRSEWTRLVDPDGIDTDHDGVITVKEMINARYSMIPLPGYEHFGRRFQGGDAAPAMPGTRGMPPGMPGPFGEPPPDDPEMRDLMRQDAEMDRKTHELAMRIRESRGDERAKLKSELSELVNNHFDVRQKRRELQLKRMEDELQRLREAISSRNKSRESIVTNHMKELIGEERDLEF
ncbi:MAG TPA: hypothetical protein VGI40_15995 [Pirellulaceae bacterium]|jgi:hypothetical protein